MRNSRQINLLRSLVEIPSPSGFEDEVANFIKQELLKFLPSKRVQIDFQKNVIATIPGTTDRTVVIDAHSDTIAFIVTNVNDDGYITVSPIGDGVSSILNGQHLSILTSKGVVNAVVNCKHHHLIADEEEAVNRICDMQIDVGIRKRSQVLKNIKIGDPVIYKPKLVNLLEDYYSGYGLDDKAGCYILLETIREIVASKQKPNANLVFVFSSQEETLSTKLLPVVREYKPNLCIEVDVTFATDYWEEEELEIEVGRCNLGSGMVIYRGVDIHVPSVALMEQIAKKTKTKIQYQASGTPVGYTATEMTGEGQGVRAMILGIPQRNMHSPTETICFKDLTGGVKLLQSFLLNSKLRSVIEK